MRKQGHHAQLVLLDISKGEAEPVSRNEKPAETLGQLAKERDHFSDDAPAAKLRDWMCMSLGTPI